MKPEFYLTVLMRFKDERHMLSEWISHHLRVGVEHFWLIDDGSRDGYDFSEHTENVTLFKSNAKQGAAYNDVYNQIRNRTEWLIVIDCDEFLFNRGENLNLQPKLRALGKRVAGVKVFWNNFLPLGVLLDPVSKIGALRRKLPRGTGHIRDLHKTICRTSRTRRLGLHSHKHKGRVVKIPIFQLNHYKFPSYEATYGNKEPKGGGSSGKKRYSARKDPLSNSISSRTVVDNFLAKRSTDLIAQLKKGKHLGPKIYEGRWRRKVMPKIQRLKKKKKQVNDIQFHRIMVRALSR